MADDSEMIVKANGPLLVRGNFVVKDGNSQEFDLSGRTAISLSRCGHSNDKPFCDGRHNQAGFDSSVKTIRRGRASLPGTVFR